MENRILVQTIDKKRTESEMFRILFNIKISLWKKIEAVHHETILRNLEETFWTY